MISMAIEKNTKNVFMLLSFLGNYISVGSDLLAMITKSDVYVD